MKGFIRLIIILTFLMYPAVSFSSYFVRLKSGASFMTYSYWEKNGQIRFYHAGGIVGFHKSLVKEITYTDTQYKEVVIVSKTSEKSDELPPQRSGVGGEKKDAKDKKEELEQKLYWAKAKLNKSIVNKDQYGIETSKREIQELQHKLSLLSQEPKKNNPNKDVSPK